MLSRQHDKLKKAVKYTAIGLATAYVVATGCAELRPRLSSVYNTSACERYQSIHPPTIELNMENYRAAPDGTAVGYPTIDTLCINHERTRPLEEE